MPDMPLVLNALQWQPKKAVFRLGPLTAELKKGQFTAIIGANGSGKSSLFQLISGQSHPGSGALKLFGRSPGDWEARARGRLMAYLSQQPERPFGFSVLDYVNFGRFPHLGPFRHPAVSDKAIACREIDAWGLSDFIDRPVDTLSGGEFQRVRLARAFTQEPGLLLLDEPGNHLDMASRIRILRRLKKETLTGRSILAVIHEVNDALLYADQVWLMADGQFLEIGTPSSVLCAQKLESLYGIKLTEFHNSHGMMMLGVDK